MFDRASAVPAKIVTRPIARPTETFPFRDNFLFIVHPPLNFCTVVCKPGCVRALVGTVQVQPRTGILRSACLGVRFSCSSNSDVHEDRLINSPFFNRSACVPWKINFARNLFGTFLLFCIEVEARSRHSLQGAGSMRNRAA